MLEALYEMVVSDPYQFEYLAVALFKLAEPSVTAEVTRRAVDGGRDAIGELSIGGSLAGALKVAFALEAKALKPGVSGVTTSHTKRLLSRLRHRQFGVLVTTAHVASQAYQEMIDDAHPVVIIAGGDIVELLRRNGITDVRGVRDWSREVLSTVGGRS